jgi:hypothetical protein
VGGVLFDKPVQQLELPNQTQKKGEPKKVVAPITTDNAAPDVLFPNPYGGKKTTVSSLFATPNALTSQSLGFKLEPNPHLYKGNDKQS